MFDQHGVGTIASGDPNPAALISAVHLTSLPLGSGTPGAFQLGPFRIQPFDALSILPLPTSMQVLVVDSEVVFLIAHLDPGIRPGRVPTIVRIGLTSNFWLPPSRFPVLGTIWRLRDLADPAILRILFPPGSTSWPRAA
jgi:hypothetical protein